MWALSCAAAVAAQFQGADGLITKYPQLQKEFKVLQDKNTKNQLEYCKKVLE